MERPKNYEELIWHSVEEGDMPKDDGYILLTFENFDMPLIGRCEGNEEEGYIFYEGNDSTPLVLHDLYVSHWMPLPEKGDEA